jgi:NAD-dependent deacetylase
MSKDAMPASHRPLSEFLRGLPPTGTLVVVTGAGISLASGIPTFRGTDPGAIWKHDVTTLGTNAFFEEDPVESWRWYLSRFGSVLSARPNPAHEALAALERWHVGRRGGFLLVTQNVDTLHEQAGSERLVKIHGSADRVRCSREGCRHGAPAGSLPRADFDIGPFVSRPSVETLPRCPDCGALLRQHVLWFDEYYDSHRDYEFRRVTRTVDGAARVLFVGTSFSVGVTDAILRSARFAGAEVLSIDPGENAPPRGVATLRARAEEVLPAACVAACGVP